MKFDHIAISGQSLAEATAHVQDALGVPLQSGGEHAIFHTHNTLLGLEDGLYLEAIAINPDAPQPDRARWFDLDRFKGTPRLTNWICRCDDLVVQCDALGPGFGAPVDLARGDLRWRMAVPESGILPFDNKAPALIEWQTDVHPATRLTAQGVRLRRLIVAHPEARSLQETLAPQFTDPRVVFEPGDAALRSEFDTPHGPRAIGG